MAWASREPCRYSTESRRCSASLTLDAIEAPAWDSAVVLSRSSASVATPVSKPKVT